MGTVATDLIESPLTDLRGVSLADLTEDRGVVDEVIRRVLPDTPAAPVTVAAFQSAI